MAVSRKTKATGSAKSEKSSTRQRVVQAAVELFAHQGFNGTGIRDMASAAGLTTATLYHYISNKDDLLVELMVAATAPLYKAAERITKDIDDPARRLAMIVEQHVWAHASDRLPALVADTELRALSGERRERVVTLRDSYEGVWRAAVQFGVDSGRFEPGNAEIATKALLQMSTGVSHWFSTKGKLSLNELCEEYSDWALALVRAKGPDGPVRRSDLNLPSPDHYITANAAEESGVS